MTPESNIHPHDDLAIYALDALDPDEHAALEAHLATCPACRAELDEHREVLARLVVADEEPPASVWAGIAQQLPSASVAAAPEPADDAALVVPLHAPLHARRRGRAERTGWLAAAAALVVVVGLGVALVGRGGDKTETVADLAAAAADAPGATIVPLETDGGDEVARVVLAGEAGDTDYVIFDGLAPLPAGRTYQLWKTEGATSPVSLGVLGDGTGEAAAIAAPADVTTLALTDEPAAGSPAPTTPILASGQPA
ncbi:MAG TPA: anti-sigma factor [Acidimicrobiales bacterium]|nr:anti-sigma factor [Acidimicrobiales bacterium]